MPTPTTSGSDAAAGAGEPLLRDLTAPRDLAQRLHRDGVWRNRTVVQDVAHWAAATPHAPALVAHRADGSVTRLSYGQYARAVETHAVMLRELGVRPGDVVTLWLPNRWELATLMLASWRLGAIVAPVVPTVGRREVERMLLRIGTSVCITADVVDERHLAAELAELSPRCPGLRTQLVLGQPAQGQLAFPEHVHAPPAAQGSGGAEVTRDRSDPDRASIVLFTSGTTGEPRAVVHSLNTAAAPGTGFTRAFGYAQDDRFLIPNALAHTAGMLNAIFLPLPLGASAVITERNDAATVSRVIVDERVSVLGGVPAFLDRLLEAFPDSSAAGGASSLREVYTGGTAPSARLVERVRERFGVEVRGVWGSTEASNLFTRTDDPAGSAARSVGRPVDGMQVRLDPEPSADDPQPARLLLRGSGVCLGLFARDGASMRVVAEHDGGWHDTGDLAVPDGRGGCTITGRSVDRVGDRFMIPVADVERVLTAHAGVGEAAVVGVPDGDGHEVVCAVVTASDPANPPSLSDLREYLTASGMTEWYLPERLEVVRELPRNETGKVVKRALVDGLRTAPPEAW